MPKRDAAESKRGCFLLPEELMIMVVRKLDGMGYRKAIASLRLVSQSWKAAVREHPMRANPIRVERNCELRKLCQIMPKMRELSIFSQEQVINLLPLSGLTSLTKVSLYGFEYAALTEVPQLRANLSTLPSTLKTLNLTYVDLPPNCLNSLNVTNLKLLNLELEATRILAVWKMLQQLPNLEELHYGGVWEHQLFPLLKSFPKNGSEWCPGLTQLELFNGYLIEGTVLTCPPRLKEAKFCNLAFSKDWLNTFTSTAHHLTSLQLHICSGSIYHQNNEWEAPLSPVSTLSFRNVVRAPGTERRSLSSISWQLRRTSSCNRKPLRAMRAA